MEELEKLVNKVVGDITSKKTSYENKEKNIVSQLQAIGKEIVTNYNVQVGNITIDPIWVEAYYYNKYEFPDCNSHMQKKQKNHFNKLYLHDVGVDVCLSNNDDYYLSFLIKGFLYNGQYYSQSKICKREILKEKIAEGKLNDLQEETALVPKSNPIDESSFTVCIRRNNMARPLYRDTPLGIFRVDENFENCDMDFPKGHKKTWRKAIWDKKIGKKRTGEAKYVKLAEEEFDSMEKGCLKFQTVED